MLQARLFYHPYIDIIKHYEGWVSRPYRCPAGKWTIGWGHLCEAAHPPITPEHLGITYLREDLGEALSGVERLAPFLAEGPEQRVVALTSWVFNLGSGNLASSTLLRRLREGRWNDAASEMLRWDKATGPDGVKRVLPGLVKRRQSEAHLFLTGECKIF